MHERIQRYVKTIGFASLAQSTLPGRKFSSAVGLHHQITFKNPVHGTMMQKENGVKGRKVYLNEQRLGKMRFNKE